MNCIRTLAGFSSEKDTTSCRQLARDAVPYLLIELILPGGTLVAAVLWLLRRKGMPI